ncbi:MAG TPA: 50S ribosomal protein L5 [Candidatus Magasanikbacteria bacterium]|nr:MAG: 50S ribosomal protein L5 [Candidatus Magasanikbacteria bacterium RIFCSPLOWO2_02_FULL_47_16]OGH79317.1 MAG: 50S ribosomal protein L5 [Candidatus Magasanikbacteria bacterium RIFCSPHIGHO2_02_FULL_48_18]OGH81888.1 MAG: 50S ribosomal protein L5 [Candidatus Magasanikbacteria bacterium RIFCSPLOWO2_12_FULL_47_9b]HAZ28431.1 50S ribosomal protein L5 [Candidatus Magasanikbacteria bacterium]
MPSPLYRQYKTQVVPSLKAQFGYASVMQVPRVQKVVVNVGYGRHVKDKSFIDLIEKNLATITGQKPVHNAAKKSISNFKTRKGMNVGVSVLLRGDRMYDFLYRLIHLALPRVRDFRGLSPKAFDSKGNFSIGLKEVIAFPEISADLLEHIHGLEITIVTNAKTNDEGRALLKALGMPIQESGKTA